MTTYLTLNKDNETVYFGNDKEKAIAAATNKDDEIVVYNPEDFEDDKFNTLAEENKIFKVKLFGEYYDYIDDEYKYTGNICDL